MSFDFTTFNIGVLVGFSYCGILEIIFEFHEYLKLKRKKLRQEAAE